MKIFLCQLFIASLCWQFVSTELRLTNDIIEEKLSPQLFKIHHKKGDSFSDTLYQAHNGPRTDWNDTIIKSDLSHYALNNFILDKIENMTKLFLKMDEMSIDPDNLEMINEIELGNRNSYLSAITDMTSFFTSSFTCSKNERQFSFVQNNTARVCCNTQSGATRSCQSHRCLGRNEKSLKSCCSTKSNLRFCPGSLTETVDVGSGTIGRCTNKNAFINIKSNSARVCCISSSVCTSLFPCMKIVQRTSVKNPNNRFLCCQSFINRFFYCSSASATETVVVQSSTTSTTPTYGGPVNPGYYARPPQPPPPVVQPNPTNPAVYPPPQPQPPYVPYVRPVRVTCQYTRTDLADAFSDLTERFARASMSLHYLRNKFALESPQLMSHFNLTQFSEISNGIISKISQFKEKQAIIRRFNKKLALQN